ncbi:hypothetical protein [Aquimarina agarilytica]|uniref:hypothetical protein n=1 Tax=Aquimarina agarilytica TaxID=1087449 RepID=UPI000287C241|nr:hypothetical protein [Aquimarina agarilytica]
MKKPILITCLSLFALLASCSKNDDGNTPNAVNNNSQEENSISLQNLDEGISISRAKKITESLPTPTGNINFNVENTQSATLNNGFSFEINVPDNYAGAYIQFQTADGNEKSSSYFDIPKESFGSGFKQLNNSNKGLKIVTQKSTNNNSTEEIDVVFNETIPPGKFCYTICIYDADNNISQLQEVCVEVEAWGGSNELVGKWNLEKIVYENETGETKKTVLLGEEDCDINSSNSNITCDNGETITINNQYCDITSKLEFTINSDGTASFLNDGIEKSLDYKSSKEQCNEVFKTDNFTYKGKGNWAYDEEEKNFILVTFEDENFINGELEEQTNDDDEGPETDELNVVSVSGNELIFVLEETTSNSTITIDENGNQQEVSNENTTEIIKYHFKK